jgi:CheY-like chemotaxis protein
VTNSLGEILLIEDDEDIRLTMIEFLEMEGIKAEGCVNGEKALEHLNSRRENLPKLILVDLNMPLMDGPAFRRAQMADPEFSQIPCFILSADGNIGSISQELGVNGVIKKPVDLDQLLAVVRSV